MTAYSLKAEGAKTASAARHTEERRELKRKAGNAPVKPRLSSDLLAGGP